MSHHFLSFSLERWVHTNLELGWQPLSPRDSPVSTPTVPGFHAQLFMWMPGI